MTAATTATSTRYRFEDFTHAQYRSLVVLAKTKYVFRTYSDFVPGERFVLWRHDLDFSIADALPLARIEAEEGVRGNYFIHLNGDFYNPFSPANLRRICEIASLGHSVGLHFDFEHHRPADLASMSGQLEGDAQRLRQASGLPVQAFSFHNPTQEALAYDAQTYAGLVNTYARYFRQEVGYCSDSNGHWRHRRLRDVLEEEPQRPLQVLTHPTWWTEEVMSPREKIERTLRDMSAAVLADYTTALAAAGRKDVSA